MLALAVALLTWQAPAADADGLTPLMRAAARGDIATVTTTLVAAAPTSTRAHAQLRLTPLMFAAYGGHDAAVRLLLEKGATPNLKDASGASAADWASQGGHEAVGGPCSRRPARSSTRS